MGLLVEALTLAKKNFASYAEMGREMGIAEVSIRRLANGYEGIRLQTLKKIAVYLKWGPAEVGQVIWEYEPRKRRRKNEPQETKPAPADDLPGGV
jgi:DNA-binding Xre family transcriptional regulator